MTKFQIETPVRGFSGESAGVSFSKGTGYVNDTTKDGRAALEYFRRQGYGIVAVDDDHKPLDESVQDLVTGEAPAGKPGMFDPDKHSIEQVLDHLRKVDESIETRRVLAAEAEGKNRKEIAEGGAALLDEQQARDETPTTTPPAVAPAAAQDTKKGARK